MARIPAHGRGRHHCRRKLRGLDHPFKVARGGAVRSGDNLALSIDGRNE
jgi:hypothetical protein